MDQIFAILKKMTPTQLFEFVRVFGISLPAFEFLALLDRSPVPAFSVPALTFPEPVAPNAKRIYVRMYAGNTKFIQIIKAVRALQGLSLKDAKDYVDSEYKNMGEYAQASIYIGTVSENAAYYVVKGLEAEKLDAFSEY